MSGPEEGSAGGRWHLLRKSVAAGFSAAALTVCVPSVLGLASDAYWPFFFLDQLRVHYAVLLVLGGVAALLLRKWFVSAVVLVSLALNLYLLFPVLRPGAPTGMSMSPSLALLHANLGRQRAVPTELAAYLKQNEIHLLLLQEVSQPFLDSACTNLPDFRVVLAEPRPDTKGVAVFAANELPDGASIDSASFERLAGDVADRSSIALQLTWDDRPVRLLSFHCIRPGAGNKLAIHRAEYDALAEWFREAPREPAVAIGDFNSTPWSQRMRSMLRAAELPTCQDALNAWPTWPSGPLLSPGVPIDLCVHSAGVRVIRTQVGPGIGSDHLPLCCVVSLSD